MRQTPGGGGCANLLFGNIFAEICRDIKENLIWGPRVAGALPRICQWFRSILANQHCFLPDGFLMISSCKKRIKISYVLFLSDSDWRVLTTLKSIARQEASFKQALLQVSLVLTLASGVIRAPFIICILSSRKNGEGYLPNTGEVMIMCSCNGTLWNVYC